MLMKDLSVESRLEGKSRSRRTRRGCGSNGNKKRWGWPVDGGRVEERSGWVGIGI